VLAGIGYTVSLLVVQLALPDERAQQHAAMAVLAASVLASLVALALLRLRARAHGTPAAGTAGTKNDL
jgi:Na+:H+ antiporter, NhaA family